MFISRMVAMLKCTPLFWLLKGQFYRAVSDISTQDDRKDILKSILVWTSDCMYQFAFLRVKVG